MWFIHGYQLHLNPPHMAITWNLRFYWQWGEHFVTGFFLQDYDANIAIMANFVYLIETWKIEKV